MNAFPWLQAPAGGSQEGGWLQESDALGSPDLLDGSRTGVQGQLSPSTLSHVVYFPYLFLLCSFETFPRRNEEASLSTRDATALGTIHFSPLRAPSGN